MARRISLFVIKCICFFTFFYYVKCQISKITPPSITSVTVLYKSVQNLSYNISFNYLIKIEGENLHPRMLLRLTNETGNERDYCESGIDDFESVFFHPRFVNETVGLFFVIFVNNDIREPLYLCVGDETLKSSINPYSRELIKWIHQGRNVFLFNDNRQNNDNKRSFFINPRLDIIIIIYI